MKKLAGFLHFLIARFTCIQSLGRSREVHTHKYSAIQILLIPSSELQLGMVKRKPLLYTARREMRFRAGGTNSYIYIR